MEHPDQTFRTLQLKNKCICRLRGQLWCSRAKFIPNRKNGEILSFYSLRDFTCKKSGQIWCDHCSAQMASPSETASGCSPVAQLRWPWELRSFWSNGQLVPSLLTRLNDLQLMQLLGLDFEKSLTLKNSLGGTPPLQFSGSCSEEPWPLTLCMSATKMTKPLSEFVPFLPWNSGVPELDNLRSWKNHDTICKNRMQS